MTVLPLASLQARWRAGDRAWLIGGSAERLLDVAQRERDRLRASERILLVESDPVQLLAIFIASVERGCNVFLGSPQWRESEWQQAIALVVPNWIYRKGDRVPSPSLATNVPTPLATFPAIGIPTGGSSGQLRFALHDWQTLTAAAQGFQTYFGGGPVRAFCTLPLYHVSGLMQFVRVLNAGGQLAIASYKSLHFDMHTGALIAEPELVNIARDLFFISLVPTQLQRLMAAGGSRWLAGFGTVLLGGAPAWNELLAAARSESIRLAPTYGMTETASQVATLKPEDFLAGRTSSGCVLPHARVTIRGADGELLPPLQVGTIAIAAESLCWGYLPGNAIAREFLTDDVGYVDDDGQLVIVGRRSRKIVTGGENVTPEEIEAVIRSVPQIRDVCVVGIPDREWGEVVAAVVVLSAPAADTLPTDWVALVKAELRDRLSSFKQPKVWIACNSFPRNDRGKTDCARVREFAIAQYRRQCR
ncbi:acyl-CoA synthetase (AMP-forming)/AMP-acid ligase II [Rubidibacter lacunae KORDI 51-2]|uniref:Acyl-CoA synthetase (AMP-forming)/AMP-acid ligase II n=1 Tax=Rubidibacter lacunae KORDI 51-2 TaxID=582515 RepID=U5DCF1_9CHRO|nr:AMP-binding protein [Rubidibacter lacunae]ERN42208.1 acyl-CoA synthetase (AMP-forming)/AMP-acid ligase II [Rubidibacter lacunae KORDI 51-2]